MNVFKGALLAASCLCPCVAQTAPILNAADQPRAVQSVAVQEVFLDVVARDKKGRPVKDLKPEDLVISDNGTTVKPLSFQLIDGREARNAETGAKAATAKQGFQRIRLVSLVFDRLQQNGRTLARKAAEDFLSRPLPPGTYIAVFSIEHRLRILQPFTDDIALLQTAVERATNLSVDLGRQSSIVRGQLISMLGVADDDRILQEKIDEVLTPVAAPANGPPDTGALVTARFTALMLQMIEFDRHMAAQQEGYASLGALLALVRDQNALPGRKTVLYFSEGLKVPPNLVTNFRSIIAAANRANVSVYAIDSRGLNSTTENQSAVALLKQSTSAIRREQSTVGGVGVAVDQMQVKAADQADDSLRENTINPLAELAESTGGFLVTGSNDLRKPVQHIAEDASTYYQVTYAPPAMKYDGSFRKIHVAVLRPDITLQSRSGYFALPPGAAGKSGLSPFDQALMRAVNASPRASAIPYSLRALTYSSPQNASTQLVLEMPLSQVSFVRDDEKKEYRLHTAALFLVKDAAGEVRARFSKDLPSHGPLDKLDGVRASEFIYRESLALPTGKYLLEAAVVDMEGERAGVRSTEFEITEPGKGLGMSDLVMVRQMIDQKSAPPDPANPFRAGTSLVVPTLQNTIHKGAEAPVFLVVYPAPGSTETPEISLELIQNGEVLKELASDTPPVKNGAPISLYFQGATGNVDPGAYQVRATVKQGKEQISRVMNLQIQP